MVALMFGVVRILILLPLITLSLWSMGSWEGKQTLMELRILIVLFYLIYLCNLPKYNCNDLFFNCSTDVLKFRGHDNGCFMVAVIESIKFFTNLPDNNNPEKVHGS